ncbi:MAG TPA: phosphate/phosphite/phosphonate ABC transporter substrate-binding protein [Anaeromyxobacteraceae bacterium]|nr:phosphate/phosphite/phosphonate ABC transporter substrate-binding protein [Anaeromyxobacteraceae bacterium]
MRTFFAALALALAFPGAARAADPLTEAVTPLDPAAPIRFGMSQPNGPKRAAEGKAVLEPYLSEALKRPVTVIVFESYDDLSQALAAGKVDLAWVEPAAFVAAQERNRDVQAIAKALRHGKLFYRAAIIVRADSPAQALPDLKGKAVAWVSKTSASGYLFPRALLVADGIDPAAFFKSQTFEGDHPRVCAAVRAGQADAGATFADERPKGESPVADGCAESPPVKDFRVLAVSAPIPNDVVASRPGFDERLSPLVLQVFARMSQSEAGRRVLRDVFRVDGWGVAVEGDFVPVAEAMRAAGATAAPAKAKKAAKQSK